MKRATLVVSTATWTSTEESKRCFSVVQKSPITRSCQVKEHFPGGRHIIVQVLIGSLYTGFTRSCKPLASKIARLDDLLLQVFIEDVLEYRWWIVKCAGVYAVCSDWAKDRNVDRRVLHSTDGQWFKTYCESKPRVPEGEDVAHSAIAEYTWCVWSHCDQACVSLAEGRKSQVQQQPEAAVVKCH